MTTSLSYSLLEGVAAKTRNPLTVITNLLSQLDRARAAVQRGRVAA